MIIYTKEKGYDCSYKLDHEKKLVNFKNSEYVISASLALYTEVDERLITNAYYDFRRIYKGDLMTLYRSRKLDGINYFIKKRESYCQIKKFMLKSSYHTFVVMFLVLHKIKFFMVLCSKCS